MEAKSLIHRIDVRQGCLVWAAALLGRNHGFSSGQSEAPIPNPPSWGIGASRRFTSLMMGVSAHETTIASVIEAVMVRFGTDADVKFLNPRHQQPNLSHLLFAGGNVTSPHLSPALCARRPDTSAVDQIERVRLPASAPPVTMWAIGR